MRGPDGGLYCLLGPGGFGKTRLALQLARSMQRDLPGGTWAVDLTEARSAEAICGAVAAALGVSLDRADPVGQLGRALGGKGRALFVFDNLEGCLGHLPETLGRWVEAAPSGSFLGTSRVTPRLRGEVAIHLGELAPADSLALLESRASRPFLEADLARARELCDALEHVPLAIELCAARLRVVGLDEVVRRLGLSLLAGGGPELPERQRSVTASLDWSCKLLGAAARDALGQLAVFAGGFTLESAEAVLDLDGHDAWALDVLQELVEANLVRVDARTRRFSMLSVVREYAARRRGPEGVARAGRRHLSHFAAWGDPAALEVVYGPGAVERTRRYENELPNLLEGCGRAVALGEGALAVATLGAAWVTLFRRGPVDQARPWIERILALPDLESAVRGRAELLAARIASETGRLEAASAHLAAASRLPGAGAAVDLQRATVELALGRVGEAEGRLREVCAAAEASGLARIHATALVALASLVIQRGRPAESELHADTALTLAMRVGDARLVVGAQLALGRVYRETGRMGASADIVRAALRTAQGYGSVRDEAIALSHLANLDFELGRLDEALEGYRACAVIARDAGDLRGEAFGQGNLGMALGGLGRLPDAAEALERAGRLHERSGDRRMVAINLSNLSDVDVMRGELERAHDGYLRALGVARELGDRRFEAHVQSALGDLLRVLGRPVEARVALEQVLHAHRLVGNPRGEARSLGALALVHLEQGEPGLGSSLASRAIALAAETGDRVNEGLARVAAARCFLAAADPAAARDVLEGAVGLVGSPWSEGLAWCVHVEVARALGDLPGRARARAEVARCRAASGAGPRSELGVRQAAVNG